MQNRSRCYGLFLSSPSLTAEKPEFEARFDPLIAPVGVSLTVRQFLASGEGPPLILANLNPANTKSLFICVAEAEFHLVLHERSVKGNQHEDNGGGD
jgi:hypothetical protein